MSEYSFCKPPLTIKQQIEMLQERHLRIKDPEQATHYLNYLGYYRLRGYALHFEVDNKTHFYQQGTNFQDILDLYDFDRRLRLHFLDAIERIEVSLKSVLVNQMSLRFGSHWYLNSQLFKPMFKHVEFLNVIKREAKLNSHQNSKQELYIKDYYKRYKNPDMPPVWMLFETISFGTVSIALKYLLPVHTKKISKEFRLPYKILVSWVESLSYVRNLCAHHSRLWNRHFTKKPKILHQYNHLIQDNGYLDAQILVASYVMHVISENSTWHEKLKNFLEQNKSYLKKDMLNNLDIILSLPDEG